MDLKRKILIIVGIAIAMVISLQSGVVAISFINTLTK
ncbi:hypothetical protein BH10BAC4_BH10BAC4_05810 [soil metagenome]